MTDVRLEATLTAAQNHCHIASVPVTKSLVQRSRTYDTFTEAYHSSERQEEVRRVQFDLISGGALRIEREDLKKSYKYVYKYMLSLGTMDKGEYLCINMDQQSVYENFDT